MGWRDRLREASADSYPAADSANGANRPTGKQQSGAVRPLTRPIGAIGAFDIETFSAKAAEVAPAEALAPELAAPAIADLEADTAARAHAALHPDLDAEDAVVEAEERAAILAEGEQPEPARPTPAYLAGLKRAASAQPIGFRCPTCGGTRYRQPTPITRICVRCRP